MCSNFTVICNWNIVKKAKEAYLFTVNYQVKLVILSCDCGNVDVSSNDINMRVLKIKWMNLFVVTHKLTIPSMVLNSLGTIATWLILPVVIRSSQRLSHACLSMNILL